MSRFDNNIDFNKVSKDEANLLHKIFDEAEKEINFVLNDCRCRITEDKKYLVDEIREDINENIKSFINNRKYNLRPWNILHDKIDTGHRLAVEVHADSLINICAYYLGPKLKKLK